MSFHYILNPLVHPKQQYLVDYCDISFTNTLHFIYGLGEVIAVDIKGIYLSKALTCMKIFLYKQEFLFCQGEGYLWPHCCMNNLYISHRSLYAPAYSF